LDAIEAKLGSGDAVPWAGRFMDGGNTWWYERGDSYSVTLVWGYGRGRFVWFGSHLRDAACGEVRSWWITCVGLRTGRSVE